MRNIIRFKCKPFVLFFLNSISRHDVHDLASAFEDEGLIKDHQKMIHKGFISHECFDILHADSDSSDLSSDETREFLIALNLATPIADPPSVYVSSLISAENEVFLKKEIQAMEVNPDALAFYFSFKKSESVSNLYSKLLSRLASKEFFYESQNAGITFHVSFAAKIEERNLEVIAATKGTFKWTVGSKNIPIDFIITEEDNTASDQRFARFKVNIDLLFTVLRLSTTEFSGDKCLSESKSRSSRKKGLRSHQSD